MKFKDKAFWSELLYKNPENEHIYTFAQSWAEFMEPELEKDRSFDDMAEMKGLLARTRLIDDSAYGMAVSILTQVWEHGPEFREWHDRRYGR